MKGLAGRHGECLAKESPHSNKERGREDCVGFVVSMEKGTIAIEVVNGS